MKNFILLCALILISVSTFAETKTVYLEYDYDIEYKKISAEVLCVTSVDANENGDGDIIQQDVIWFSPKSYSEAKKLQDAGYKPVLNGEKGEQCDQPWNPGTGKTPTVTVYTYAYISAADVKAAMKRENKSFVKREIVFKKSSYSKEILFENLSTAKDDVMWEIWNNL